jgi:hypothetical protein
MSERQALVESKTYLANNLDYTVSGALNGPMGSAVDPRHLELIADRMGDRVKITDSGSSPFMPGQFVSRKEVDAWNKKNSDNAFFDGDVVDVNNTDRLIGAMSAKDYDGIVRKREIITKEILGTLMIKGHSRIKVFPKMAVYEGQIRNIENIHTVGDERWFSNLGARDTMRTISDAATFGYKDPLLTPSSRQMAGLLQPLGEGFKSIFSFDKNDNVESALEKGVEFTNSIGKTLMGMFKR